MGTKRLLLRTQAYVHPSLSQPFWGIQRWDRAPPGVAVYVFRKKGHSRHPERVYARFLLSPNPVGRDSKMPLGLFIAPYGAYAVQPEPETSAVTDFCPLAANMNSPTQWSVPAPCWHPRCAATSFAPPPPSRAGLLPSCTQREPVLSTLAEFGARDAGAAAAPAGFEQQMILNGCQLHSGNGLSSETAPLIDLGATTPSIERAAEVPCNTLSGQHLLQNAAQIVQSLSGAVEALLTARKPIYPGYGDLMSARDFLDSLAHYQQAMGLDDEEILTRIIPVALTETAARWQRLSGHRAVNFGKFCAAFLREFLPADYERRMRRELELSLQPMLKADEMILV